MTSPKVYHYLVSGYLHYVRSLGQNLNISLKDLNHKLATYLALLTAGRSSDLVLLSVNHFTSTLEGLKFTLSGLSRLNHMRPPLLIQKYDKDFLICPVKCFNTYVAKTNLFRSTDDQGLFSPALGISQPHAPMKACSITCWIKSTLSSAGIDTNTFSAHSTRGATTSKALKGGATLTWVLQQADWSSARTFRGFYFRPSNLSSFNFSLAVLSSAHMSKLHADIEPEHSEV